MRWKKETLSGTPRGFAEQVPIYEVIARYILQEDDEHLLVDRVFAGCREFLCITYEGKLFYERITLFEGKITSVHSTYKMPFPDDSTQPWSVVESQLALFLDPPPTPLPMYQNIKRFEEYLRLIPWQKDFIPLYSGNGIFFQPRLCAKNNQK